MKFIIVGLHSSGKHEIAKQLEDWGMKVGKLFSNCSNINQHPDLYNSDNFEEFSNNDVNEVFENNAYIFIHEHLGTYSVNAVGCFEGLSKYSYDNNDVFVLSPDQLLSISESNIPSDAVYIVIDNTLSRRKEYYRSSKFNYDFANREKLETADIKEYIKTLYNMAGEKILYFTNEETERVAAIIYAIYKHPDLLETFIKNFN